MPHTQAGEFDWTKAESLRRAVEMAVTDLTAIADRASAADSEMGDEVGKVADFLAQHLA